MLRGIYTAATSMENSMRKMDLFAENVSNSQTFGYKKKTVATHGFRDMLVQMSDKKSYSPLATGAFLDQAGVRQAQGVIRNTGNPLDLAIEGEGAYFQVELANTPQGQPARYGITRNGRLTLNMYNELVNTQGDYVLDNQNRRIRLQDPNAPQNPNQRVPNLSMPLPQIMVNDLGQIYNNQDNNKTVLGQIKLVRYTDQPGGNDANMVLEIMKKYGYALPADNQLLQALDPNQVIDPQDPTSRRPRIIQGSLEDSNVSIVSEMIGLMMTSKDYDMSQKMISTQDKILDKSINELGRLQ